MALDDALTAEDVAKMLRVSRNTVYNLVKRDQLASYHVGRKMRFTRADVENYIARGTAGEPGRGLGAEAAGPAPVAVVAATAGAGASAVAAGVAPAFPVERDPSVYVIAGNDVAGDVLANYLGGFGHAVGRHYLDSYAALIALYRGEADAALCHLFDGATGTYNVEYVRRLVPGAPVRLVRVAARQQGLIVRRGNPKGIHGWRDLLRGDVALVNRELGSGSRVLLDEELHALGIDQSSQVRGYGNVASSALSMASCVEREVADVGIGTERVARQVDSIEFVPMRREFLDVALSLAGPTRAISEAAARLLRTRAFREEVAAITGYDLSEAGTVLLEV